MVINDLTVPMTLTILSHQHTQIIHHNTAFLREDCCFLESFYYLQNKPGTYSTLDDWELIVK